MSTVVVEEVLTETERGIIQSHSTVEADMYSGADFLGLIATGSNLARRSFGGGLHTGEEMFVGFTPVAPDLLPSTASVALEVFISFVSPGMLGSGDSIFLYGYDFGTLTTADWQTPADLNGGVYLGALDEENLVVGAYCQFTLEPDLLVLLQSAAPLRYVIALGSLQDQEAYASGESRVVAIREDEFGFAQDSFRLTLTYEYEGATMEGNQASPSGAVAFSVQPRLAGSQPAPSGTVEAFFAAKGVSGNQPAPSGSLTVEGILLSYRRQLALPRGSARATSPRPVRGSISTSRDGTL